MKMPNIIPREWLEEPEEPVICEDLATLRVAGVLPAEEFLEPSKEFAEWAETCF